MQTYLNTLPLLNRCGHMLLLSHFFIGMGYLGIYVVLFNLYLARLGYGAEFIGLVNGLAVLTYALLCVPAGLLGKQWGFFSTATPDVYRNSLFVGAAIMALAVPALLRT
jgi:hypothetical protein